MFSSRGVMFLLSSSPLPSSLLLSSEGDSVFHFWLCSSGKPIHRWFSTCWRQRRTLMCLSTVLLPKNLSRSSALNPNTINKRFLHWNTQSSQSTQKNWNTVIVTHGNSWTLLPHKGSGVPAIEWMNPMCLLDAQISSNPKTKMEISSRPTNTLECAAQGGGCLSEAPRTSVKRTSRNCPKTETAPHKTSKTPKTNSKCAPIGRAWPTQIPKHAPWLGCHVCQHVRTSVQRALI